MYWIALRCTPRNGTCCVKGLCDLILSAPDVINYSVLNKY